MSTSPHPSVFLRRVKLIFQREPGVVSTAVGYTGGSVDEPSYKDVCRGKTGHAEAVLLTFDPKVCLAACFKAVCLSALL
jgi:peptide methionine sulfoxide reductase MsrA